MKTINEFSNRLTRYTTRMGNLKTLLEIRVGHQLPELDEAPVNELLKDYVNKSTQTIGLEIIAFTEVSCYFFHICINLYLIL